MSRGKGTVAPTQDTIGMKTASATAAPAPGPEIEMRGAKILIESLLREGVSTIFGYPGGAILHVYDELAQS